MNKSAFTIIELIIVTFFFFILTGAVVYVYNFMFKAVYIEYAVQERQNELADGLELLSRDLKEAMNICGYYYQTGGVYLTNTLQFTKKGPDGRMHTFCYYFRNDNDPWPNPPFSNQEILYELRRADITAGDNPGSSNAEDWGKIVCRDILSPVFSNAQIRSTTALSFTDRLVNIDLMAVETGDILGAPIASDLNYEKIIRLTSSVKTRN